ncbi:MAG TPA: hypothetical protein VF980_00520 [Thermoanaerobaculia bacterium]
MTGAWRRHYFALGVLTLLVAVVFAPALAQRQVFNFRDHSDYFQPLRYYTSIHIRSFLLPYWNPYSASGEPWLANPQTGVFYPPTWLFIVLPFDIAFMLYLALHLALLGFGAYLLFARFVPPGAALAGATIATFCGPAISLLDVSNNLASFAWVPLVMWCAVARASARAAAVVIAMTFLAGEPFFAAIAALLYTVIVRDVRRVAIAGLGAFGLAAIQLIPFLEMLRGSDRAARLSADQIFRESMPVSDWLRIVIPPKFTTGALDPTLSQHFIPVIYVGIPAVLLALIALADRRSWIGDRRQSISGWLILLAFAIVVAAGNRLPLTGGIFSAMPLTLFRYPSRMVPFGALAIAALAAIGWDRVRPDRRWIDVVLVLVIVADLLPRERPLFAAAPFTTNVVPYAASIGRGAKIIRMADRPITNRSAWIAGYLNLYQRRYDCATAAPVENDRYSRLHDGVLTRGRRDLLDFIGAGFVFSAHPLPFLQPIASFGPVTVFLNPTALPMATFWTRAQSFDSPEDALRAAIERPQPGTLFVSPRIDDRFAGAKPLVTAASFVALDARHSRVVVDAPADGFVMLSQQDAPSWQLLVDGIEQKKLLAAGVFRAVAVAKGRHEIVWRYRARSLALGFAMTIVTCAILFMNTFVKRNHERNFS